jgi:hypothetical protein
LWFAAAQGQRYGFPGSSEEDRKEAKAKAFAAVQKVVELEGNPSAAPRKLLKELYDPAREHSPPDENDLEVFKGDGAFEQVIYGP